ncbi:unnamed protein product [Heterobilharzia americana]|nr:unnamed protein product [Heterobilharzia americana]
MATTYSLPEVKYTQLFIDNEFIDSQSKKTFPTINPTNEQVICHVQEADQSDVNRAVMAAKIAFRRGSRWRTMDASERGCLLYKLADLIEKHADYIARLDAMDNARYYAGYADKIHGKQLPVDGNMISFTRREPLGVVACITPWNYPFVLCVIKIAPCLCAGCTIVLKPAEQTPLSALFLGGLIKEAGFPPGVVNIICGFGEITGEALTHHPDVRAISFTGSTEVGQLIMKAAATNIKHVTLELGGKSPLIIFADADIEKAAEVAHEATMVNHGQCCVAGSRVFVQAAIYEEMVDRLKKLAENRKVGDPFVSDTIQGPQVDKYNSTELCRTLRKGRWKVLDWLREDVELVQRDEMCIAREEIFGPVQCILKFETLEEVIERANATHYGLGGGVFTRDMDKAMRVAQCVEAGSFWINSYNVVYAQAPFGGFKMSGIGREFGKEAIDGYLQTKVISMPISIKNS